MSFYYADANLFLNELGMANAAGVTLVADHTAVAVADAASARARAHATRYVE